MCNTSITLALLSLLISAVTIPGCGSQQETAPPSPPQKAEEVIFQDDFSNSTSGWGGNKDADRGCAYENGELSLWVNKATTSSAAMNKGNWQLDDFSLEVAVRQVSGDPRSVCSINFRSDVSNGYNFSVENDGQYFFIKKIKDEKATVFKNWTPSTAIKTGGEVNILKVICRGAQIELYANGTKIDSFQDSSLPKGTVWLAIASSNGGGAKYNFDNFKVSKAQ